MIIENPFKTTSNPKGVALLITPNSNLLVTMSEIAKIGGINLLILISYTLFIHYNASGSQKTMEIMLTTAWAVSFHAVISLIVGAFYFRRKKPALGKAYQVSAGIVLIIGFSACLGSANF